MDVLTLVNRYSEPNPYPNLTYIKSKLSCITQYFLLYVVYTVSVYTVDENAIKYL